MLFEKGKMCNKNIRYVSKCVILQRLFKAMSKNFLKKEKELYYWQKLKKGQIFDNIIPTLGRDVRKCLKR